MDDFFVVIAELEWDMWGKRGRDGMDWGGKKWEEETGGEEEEAVKEGVALWETGKGARAAAWGIWGKYEAEEL